MNTYELLVRVISGGHYVKEDITKKMDTFLMFDRITDEQYKQLQEMMK